MTHREPSTTTLLSPPRAAASARPADLARPPASEALRPATRLLRTAAHRDDDPVAALALARLLEVHADVVEYSLLHPLPEYIDGDDSDVLRAQARSHDQQALGHLRDTPLFGDAVLFGAPARKWVMAQTYLWPQDADDVTALNRALRLKDADLDN